MKIAITGGSGHLGSVLIVQLLEAGHEVRALYHTFLPTITANNLNWVKGDVNELEDVMALVDGCEVVIHCAVIISMLRHDRSRVEKVNIGGTEILLKCLQQYPKVRLIHISSTHAVQELPWETPFDESRPYKTIHDFGYDYSKARSEQLVLNALKTSELDAVIIRPSAMVGPPDYRPSLMGDAIISFYKGNVPFLVKGGYDYVDIRAVSQAIIQSITKGKKGEIYHLTGRYYTIIDIAKKVAQLAGKKTRFLVLPDRLLLLFLPLVKGFARWKGSNPPYSNESMDTLKYGHPNMNSDKAKMDLNFQPGELDDTLNDLIDWFKKEGKL